MSARSLPPSLSWALCALVLLVAPLVAAAETVADPQALWSALTRPVFDSQKVAAVINTTLQRDLVKLTLLDGRIGFAQPVEGRVFAAAFTGRGRLTYSPQLPLERQQVAFHLGTSEIVLDFTEAVFIFADDTYAEISRQVQFASGDPSDLQKLYQDRNEKLTYYGLNWEPRLLQVLSSSQPERYAFLHAELKTTSQGYVWFDVDQTLLEEISLGQFDESRYAFNVWSSFPAGGRRPQDVYQTPDAKYDAVIQSYQLNITVEKDTTLRGTVRVSFLPRVSLRVLGLQLDPNLRVEQVADAAGSALLFFQPRDPKGRFTQFGSYLSVVLPQAAPASQPLELTFVYAGKRVVEKVGSENFFCQSYGWYPTVGNDFIFRYPFDLTLRVPKQFTAVAVGEKVEERVEGDYQVTRWVTEVPVAVAGFAFGGYVLKEEKAGKATVQVYANRNTDDIWKIRSSSLVGLESLQPARLGTQMAVEVANSLRLFEKYFGPYPYKKLAVSNIPWGYAQGWPSLLYISALSFMDSTQRHQLGIKDQVQLTDFLRAHETSHQWWGHVIGWKSYHDQWLSEGFATFSGNLYTQFRSGREEYLTQLRKNREEILAKDRYGAVHDQIGPIYAGLRLSSGKHPGGYPVIVYNKGGWVLHMLRMLLFNPADREADTRFMAMMREFTRTYYNQPASTEDFKRVAEKYMTPAMNVDGRNNLDWFFKQWVYGTGIPHYEFSYSITPQGSTLLLKGTVKQSRVPPSFVMPVPLYAHQGKQVTRLGWLNVTGPETPFEIELAFKVDKVTLNEWEDVLCTIAYK